VAIGSIGRRKSEAERVAEGRQRCDFCEDDSNPVFRIGVDQVALGGRSMMGRKICAYCLPREGFTGWSYAAGGWPDPLGRDEPLPENGDKPAGWMAIGAALERRLSQAA
jgi:hypothetical protein